MFVDVTRNRSFIDSTKQQKIPHIKSLNIVYSPKHTKCDGIKRFSWLMVLVFDRFRADCYEIRSEFILWRLEIRYQHGRVFMNCSMTWTLITLQLCFKQIFNHPRGNHCEIFNNSRSLCIIKHLSKFFDYLIDGRFELESWLVADVQLIWRTS